MFGFLRPDKKVLADALKAKQDAQALLGEVRAEIAAFETLQPQPLNDREYLAYTQPIADQRREIIKQIYGGRNRD